MKIAFDVSYVQKVRTGLGRYALELLRALLATDASKEFILHGWSFSLDLEEIDRFQKQNTHLRVAKIPGFVKRFYWNHLSFPPIERFVTDFDLFHSSDPFLPPMREKTGIATVHDLSQKRFPQFFEQRILRQERYLSRSLANAAAIIVPSHQTKDDLLEMFHLPEEKVLLVSAPVHPLFRPGSDESADQYTITKYRLKRPFALFVGTIEPRKNIVSLIKAFELLRHTHKTGLNLVLVGKRGWLYQDIFKAMDVSPVRSRIQYHQYVPDSDLASLYRLAHFFAYPSIYEGYGFPVLEAMASGTPVVTSNSSSLREIAEGAALLIDPLKTEELAHAMHTLAESSSQRAQLIGAGLQRVKEISSFDTAEKVLQLYESITRVREHH
jgi:glycosyltransferase involved in cell wall biosynthesis